ncbi:hypothetical protein TorRG33x02_161360 [Trema orientale]|uniref:DUF4283 domain-containing protein n=1 Tax=Trema orientale TaxID=63057 RepID=A0A2P5ERC7_TREOI|nr:hypothetical protein TorRG33x02_161360 [Trema orientale]
MWKDFSVSREDKVIIIEDIQISKSTSGLQFSIVGRILTQKPIQRGLLKEMLAEIWKVEKGFEIICIDIDTFLFSFGYDVERERILHGEPWHFSKALIVMKNVEKYEGDDWVASNGHPSGFRFMDSLYMQ